MFKKKFSPKHLCLLLIFMNILCSTFCITSHILKSTRKQCIEDSDCMENSYCYDGRTCLCNKGFIAINSDKIDTKMDFICVQEAEYIGDPCSYDLQCTAAFGTHAHCKLKINDNMNVAAAGSCDCNDDAHFQDNICYKNSLIGESCQVNDNCVVLLSPNIQAYCAQSRCVCPPMYHANKNGTDCLQSSNLGGPCRTDEDCIVMNTRCMNVCACKMGFVIDSKQNHCLLAAERLHSPCDEDRQCNEFQPNTICEPIQKLCKCANDSHEVTGACFKTSHLHEPCSHHHQCLIESRNQSRVECSNGFCICSNGFEMENRKDCIPLRRSGEKKSNEAAASITNIDKQSIIISLVITILLTSFTNSI